jgi:hypothetical protein
MGGALAQPCDNLPWLFPRGTIFDRYPFLLPNLVCIVVLMVGITIGILFLEETHPDKRTRRDNGRELGKWLTATLMPRKKPLMAAHDIEDALDTTPFLVDQDPPPGYQSTESSPRLTSVQSPPRSLKVVPPQTRAISRAFTPNVVFVIVGYGILA